MFHDDGASTDVTGRSVSSRARMTAGNGSLTSPEKLNPEREVSSHLTRGKDKEKVHKRGLQTEDGVYDVICRLQGIGEIVGKRDVEVLELFY